MKEKMILVEKFENKSGNYSYDFYILENKRELKNTIINECVYYLFEDIDQGANEVLEKEGNLDLYFDILARDYNSDRFLKIKKHINEIENCENIYDVIKNINDEFKLLNLNYELIMFINFNNEFLSEKDKDVFRTIIWENVSKSIDKTDGLFYLWKYEKSTFGCEGSWSWSDNLKNLARYFKYILMDNIFTLSVDARISEDIYCWGIDKIIKETMNNDNSENKEKYVKIKALLDELEKEMDYNKFKQIIVSIEKILSELGVTCRFELFKGIAGVKTLVHEHGSKWDDRNVVESLSDDVIL